MVNMLLVLVRAFAIPYEVMFTQIKLRVVVLCGIAWVFSPSLFANQFTEEHGT